MWLLYQIVLTVIAIFFIPYILYRMVGQPGEWKQRFGIYPPEIRDKFKNNSVIWIHSSSVGEVMAAGSLVKSLRRVHPEAKLIMSTMTATGRLLAEKSAGVDMTVFAPLDLKWTVRKALNNFNPALLIVIETEIWPNFIREAKKKGVPVMIACGRISLKSYRWYRLLRPFFKKVLSNVVVFSMQTTGDAQRIANIGAKPSNIKISGNMKFDRAVDLTVTEEERNSILKLLGFAPDKKIIVAGSTRKGEEEIILESYGEIHKSFPGARLVVAPRHPGRLNEITSMFKRKGMGFVMFTKLSREGRNDGGEVVLIDIIGELTRIYRVADIVFVGGSLVRKGGHNILEPASFGKSVVFGPYMDNFSEISELFISGDAAIQVADKEELTPVLLDLLENPDKRDNLGRNAAELISKNRGASDRNAGLTRNLIR